MADIRSGAAVFATGRDGLIADWNDAATRLTGIARADAEGRPCWQVIAGRNARGDLVCHRDCSIARLARQGWPVTCADLHLRTPRGRLRLTLSTIVVPAAGEGQLILHPMRAHVAVPEPVESPARPPSLTRRQREILLLLVEGVRAKEIAARLTLSETTVRNHIRAILLELGAHSQLEAVARARALALVAAA